MDTGFELAKIVIACWLTIWYKDLDFTATFPMIKERGILAGFA